MADGVLVALLAAGRARRFGGGKLDASCAGRPLGAWAVRAVERAGLPDRVIIVPQQIPLFARAAGFSLAINPVAEGGLGTSLALAAVCAMERSATALLVLLADMPLVDDVLLHRLLACPAAAAVAHAPGRPGVPALLPANTFAQLAELTGDRGAAGLLCSIPDLSLVVPPPDALLDVDDAAALQEAAILLQRRR